MWTSALVVVTLCGSLFVGGGVASRVPVLLWAQDDVGGVGAKPLLHTTAEEWEHLARKQTKAHALTVVFVEETLSPEDLSAKDDQGRTAFAGLRARSLKGSLLHMSSVPSAVSTLKEVADPDQVNRVKLTDEGLSADVHSATGKYLFIELDDAKEGEDRFRMLARHDAFINEMFDKLSDRHPSVLAIYTARYPSWEIPTERVRRELGRHLLQTPPAPEVVDGFYTAKDKVYLYAPQITFVKKDGGAVENIKITTGEVSGEDSFDVTWTTDNASTIKFMISNVQGYWTLNNVTYKDVSANVKDVYAPNGFSYSCRHLNATMDDGSLIMKQFQLQPFFTADGTNRFDSSYDCVGTMSAPIWSGLFIVILLLFIVIGGVMMMMDIRTMDRFDDPKGKTITINASE